MGQTTFYSKNYQGWPPVSNVEIANGDSPHWQTQFTFERDRLGKAIGRDGYREFAELVWPGTAIDDLTWREIGGQIKAANALVAQGEMDVNKLAGAASKALAGKGD